MPASSGKQLTYRLVGLCFFLLAWEISISYSISMHLLIPAPSDLPQAFLKELIHGPLLSSLSSSSYHTFMGIILGSTLGTLWGLLVGRYYKVELTLSPVLGILRPIPPIAWIPFSLVIFGSGTLAAMFIVAIGVFWTTFVTTISAIRSISPTLFELAEVYKIKKPLHLFLKIIIPASAPGIMGGIRTAIGQGWTLIVAAELLGVPGIGQRMWEAAGVLANEVVLVYMFVIALSYTLSDQLFLQFERRVFKWRSL